MVKRWFRRFQRGKIQRILACILLLFSCVPMVILGCVFYERSDKIMRQEMYLRYGECISSINSAIFFQIQRVNDISKMIINHPALEDLLNPKEQEMNYEEGTQQLQNLLNSILISNNRISSIYILPANGEHIYAYGEVERKKDEYFDQEFYKNYKNIDLYTDTIASYNNYIIWEPRNVLGEDMFVLTRKIYSLKGGLMGVLVIYIDTGLVKNAYSQQRVMEDSTILFMDEQGEIIFSEGREEVDPQKLYFLLSDCTEEGWDIYQDGNQKKFVVYNTMYLTPWKIVVVTPYSNITENSNLILSITIILLVLLVLLLSVVSVAVSKKFVKPLEQFVELMKQGEKRDMSVRYRIQAYSELDQLGNSFNRMMEEMKKLMEEIEQENQEKMKAQLQMLNAQFKPHFLYNTLASINVLALTEKAPRSALMTENLSKFFRITLNSGREFISIKEELEHLSSYLYIEKQRFGSRFDFQISSQPETESWITVRLLLQPLAENAVKHAFVGIKRKGLLTVSVKTEGNRIKYTVRDNGKGMQIGGIRDLLDREEAGYGLKYIDMRLKLYYKNDYTFHCVSVFGEGTVFTIDVPRLSEGGG